MSRLLNWRDLFEIKCKKCNSSDVDLNSYECSTCGNIIDFYCNECGSKFNYHDFKLGDEKEGAK